METYSMPVCVAVSRKTGEVLRVEKAELTYNQMVEIGMEFAHMVHIVDETRQSMKKRRKRKGGQSDESVRV